VSSIVLDTSAVLALLFNEPGAEKSIARSPDGVWSAVSYQQVEKKLNWEALPG
jgi:PIN domain nuclease of toxin-antitoxin system